MQYQRSLMKIQLISAVTSRRQGGCLADIELSLPWKKNRDVTVTHLEQVSSGKGEDAAKAKGILKQITTGKFARFLYFLLDVTAVLKELSESFQRADLFINDVA